MFSEGFALLQYMSLRFHLEPHAKKQKQFLKGLHQSQRNVHIDYTFDGIKDPSFLHV